MSLNYDISKIIKDVREHPLQAWKVLVAVGIFGLFAIGLNHVPPAATMLSLTYVSLFYILLILLLAAIDLFARTVSAN